MANKVREVFKNPDYSPFTKECVKVGEALEDLGYKLEAENYCQGEQIFCYSKGEHTITVSIVGKEEGSNGT